MDYDGPVCHDQRKQQLQPPTVYDALPAIVQLLPTDIFNFGSHCLGHIRTVLVPLADLVPSIVYCHAATAVDALRDAVQKID